MSCARSRYRRFRWLLAALLGSVLLAAGSWPLRPARAQDDYFRVSPGPLSVAHSVYDHSSGCTNCHISARGVENSKCLACHPGLNHPGGLHASFGGRPCIDCHAEHKGRDRSLVSWGTIGGRDAFDHKRTGFPLEHHHDQVACTKCHVRRLKSGGTAYLGLNKSCQSCHRDVHGFTDPELRSKCTSCHAPGKGLRGQRLSAWATQHQRRSGVSLAGKHQELGCTECHSGGQMAGRKPPRGCVDCHAPPHPVTLATTNCERCHSQTAPMKSATIDHQKFGFELKGRHAKVACRDCHQRGGRSGREGRSGRAPVRACADCHTANHPVVPATANCAQCHSPKRSFKGAKIDHQQFGLPLRGRHAELSCARCHKTKQKRLEYTEGACANCHTHRNAHGGQFADKPCSSCHVEGGKRDRPFDHNVDSRFPLRGSHAADGVRSKCELCHPNQLYRTGKIACRDCHEDPHHGEYGTDCARCHSPRSRFQGTNARDIDHSAFPLEGKHKRIPCRACHAGGKYDLKNPRCIDCHQKDDVHRGRLGQDCGKCHRPTKGAPKFRHDTMTEFPLEGAHRKVRCSLCHQPRRGAGSARPLSEWKATNPPPLDLGFPSPGKRCVDCHADAHHGRASKDCTTCHTMKSFAALTGARARAITPQSHRGSWLRRHAYLPETPGALGGSGQNCAVCHGTPGCRNCHRTEAPESHGGLWRLRTHGSAASFEVASCRVCHQTASCTGCHERTRPLNHRGSWPTLHGYAAGGFGASNCSVCHRRTYCLSCHTAR